MSEFCILMPAGLEAESVIADGKEAAFLADVYDAQLGCFVQRWGANLGYIHPRKIEITYKQR